MRRERLRVYAVVLAAGLAAGAVLVAQSAEAAGTLGAQAAATGRYFGAAVPAGKLNNNAYATILDREFNMITPENEMKWDTVEPSRGNFNFGPGDQIVNHALAHGQRMRGHTTVWHSQLPAWVSSITDANTLRSVMNNHITTEMKHFKGKIYAWDVVNEAFADGSTQHRASVFQKLLGNGFIEEAFRTARSADPGAKLCYNDYNIENWNAAKTQGVYAMVKDFKARGVPIDCVGLQSHFGSDGPPSSFPTTLANFAALGVAVQITELDIAQASAAAYKATVKACLNVARCAGITVWGVRDTDSWRGADDPLLFDASGNKKPAYGTVLAALGSGVPVARPSATSRTPSAKASKSPSPSPSAVVSASASLSATAAPDQAIVQTELAAPLGSAGDPPAGKLPWTTFAIAAGAVAAIAGGALIMIMRFRQSVRKSGAGRSPTPSTRTVRHAHYQQHPGTPPSGWAEEPTQARPQHGRSGPSVGLHLRNPH